MPGGYGNALAAAQDTAVKTAVEASATIYDWREGNGQPGVSSGNVKVTSVDVKKLNTAIAGISGFNGVVYVHDVAAGKGAIRLKNGATLTRDLTVVSANPVYIQGDYNTGWGGPAPFTIRTLFPRITMAATRMEPRVP